MSIKMLRGIPVPHRKNTADCVPKRIPIPAVITVPMSMHIGAPAKPVVKPGDEVKVGQLIGEAGGFVSAPIHSGVSGKVKKVEDMLLFTGQTVPAVVIETDGLQEQAPDIKPPQVNDLESFLTAVRESGVVGLGGAGFPTSVKLRVDLSKIDAILINGTECEPYITSDTRTMIDNTELVWAGMKLLQKYLKAKRIIIGIEKNKPQCIEKFQAHCQGEAGMEVAVLPARYPQGGEKVLIYNTLGKILPEGKLPIDVGAIVINCTTTATIARYVQTGMPLVEKCVTVDGSAVADPQNVLVPIGTPLKYLFDFCGGFKSEPKKVLYSGPMMGIALPSLDCPVLKNTNAVMAFNEEEGTPPEPTPCIRCGRCMRNCPISLTPFEIERAYRLKDYVALDKSKVTLCMNCGCCAYVCPAKRPLVQVNKMAKAMLQEHQAQAAAAKQ